MNGRRDFAPLPDEKLTALRERARTYRWTPTHFSISAEELYRLTSELEDAREELFRLGLCDTVDKIISEELEADAARFSVRFKMPMDDDYMFRDPKRSIHDDETRRLPRIKPPDKPFASDFEGRRLPRFD